MNINTTRYSPEYIHIDIFAYERKVIYELLKIILNSLENLYFFKLFIFDFS